jgi:hypothetical protein
MKQTYKIMYVKVSKCKDKAILSIKKFTYIFA